MSEQNQVAADKCYDPDTWFATVGTGGAEVVRTDVGLQLGIHLLLFMFPVLAGGVGLHPRRSFSTVLR